MKKISIILTSFNKQKYLKDSINSVLNQNYKFFELIIIDDASTDGSQSIIKKISKKDKRIITIFRKKNSGTASVPRNQGAKIAKYDYLCFLDADDKWKKNKLSSQINQLKKKIVFNFTACEYINDKDEKHSSFFLNYIRIKLQKFFLSKGLTGLFAYNPIILSSVMIEKKIFKKYYFDESKSTIGVEDLDLWLKILYYHPRKFSFNENKLTIIRKLNKSLNRNYSQASLRSTFCVIKFFLEKKIFNKINIFLIGILIRSLKLLYLESKKIIKKKFYITTSVLALTYISIFYTPLFWYIGNKLISYDYGPINSKNLVIMTGNGDAEYINTSYQKRYLDARQIIKKNNIKKIFILGRLQEIEESTILKSLFVMDGYNPNDIMVVIQKYQNTKENINYLEEIIKKNNINNINFLTSPYHTKRAKLLWEKQTNNIDVKIIENIENPTKKIDYNYNFSQIKLISYELIALLYNKIRGWT